MIPLVLVGGFDSIKLPDRNDWKHFPTTFYRLASSPTQVLAG